jgi:hypothetical protein
MKYVYCIPRGGFNDNLNIIQLAVNYCNKYNRILLVHSIYNINITEYFEIPYNNVICDLDKITNICCKNHFTIYPYIFNSKIVDIVNNDINFEYSKSGFKYKDTFMNLPSSDVSENIIIFVKCGGGNGYPLFKDLIFKPKIKQIISDRYKTLKKPYLSIQIRNTDYKCDYKLLYENNMDEIHSAIEIYIATDDKKALDFFVSKGLPIKNFTTFPVASEYHNLHYSRLEPHIKFIDMLSDIYICGMSDNLISSSIGGFIRLIRNCNQNKYNLNKQFELLDNK